MIFRLNENETELPRPELAEDDGLLAIGGNLRVETLLLAYTNGIFPWYEPGEEILWWCPKKRYIIRPANIHVSRSMRRFANNHELNIRLNRDFADTMHRCRMKRENSGEGTWITDEMEAAYCELNKQGFALSVDSYIDGELAGGLYGVIIGRCFFGESMYTELENGSKIALIMLARLLENNNFAMIDCQFHTDHLESMGGEYVSWDEYKELLKGCRHQDAE